jgi:hypothetical protein
MIARAAGNDSGQPVSTLGGAGRALLRLRHGEHVDRIDAGDFAAVVDGVRGDQSDAVLTLGHDATASQPLNERTSVACEQASRMRR